jgi:DNA helicase-4
MLWLVAALIAAGWIYSLFEGAETKKRAKIKAAEAAARLAEKQAYERSIGTWRSTWNSELHAADWIPTGSIREITQAYPPPRAPSSLKKTGNGLSDEVEKHISSDIARHNETFRARQRAKLKSFFDTVEKNPLTDEQIAACICMDPNVQIVAAAGSGKTSTMVAKAGYVIREGLARPDQILMLAFNSDAAQELGERVRSRLNGTKDVERIKTMTFHAFGQHVIGEATGRKPTLAEWVEPGQDIRAVSDIIDELDKNDPSFASDWLRFRTLYGTDLYRPKSSNSHDIVPDHYYSVAGVRTKSAGEKAIADWLHYHGVRFAYERSYEHDTADKTHRQYKPDFHYPEANLYHEHWAATDRSQEGRFAGYVDGVDWKRDLHARHGTKLIETTFEQFRQGELTTVLAEALTAHGIRPAFDPSILAKYPPVMNNEAMSRIVRVFHQHAKGNSLSVSELSDRAGKQSAIGYKPRIDLFMRLYLAIADQWEARLRKEGSIDFDDMLGQAIDHIETGRYKTPFEVILADEFQDSSRARIRLLKALTEARDDVHLCVVGDDWQGINRFAGADISVMMEFQRHFENSTVLKLSTTFRCPQSLCNISSEFIQKNPAQIKKVVRTTNPISGSVIAIKAYHGDAGPLADIEATIATAHKGSLSAGSGRGRPSLLILGRYRSDAPLQKIDVWSKRYDRVDIRFRTIHSSKGTEADHVAIVNMVSGMKGFPSRIQDDSLLQIPMPTPDDYPYSEERRLFYVALTRARKSVTIYTDLNSISPFLLELEKSGAAEIEAIGGERSHPCPKCGQGSLKRRNGRNGAFFGCSTYPTCSYTTNYAPSVAKRQPAKPMPFKNTGSSWNLRDDEIPY